MAYPLAEALAEQRPLMLKRAKSIVRNAADAEDVVQDAQERAWRFRGRFVAGSDPVPWLLKIVQNVAFDFLRKRDRVDFGLLDDVRALSDPLEKGVVQRDDVRSLASAVRRLAPPHRTAFVLHDLQGYSSREISARVHVPYHTVRTHLHRARLRLREALLEKAS